MLDNFAFMRKPNPFTVLIYTEKTKALASNFF